MINLQDIRDTARDLLAYYRLQGEFDREEGLLRTLLADLVDRGYSTAEQQQLLREARAMVAT